jgi:O-antigen/teichoic acid export membrane protein
MTTRTISRNFLYNLAGLLLPLGLAVVSIPLFARLAGLDRLGFLTLAFAVLGYLGLLDLGLTRVFARRIAVAATRGELDHERVMMQSVERWLLVGTSLIAVLLAVATPTHWLAGAGASAQLLGEVHWAWVVLVTSVPALVLSNLWRGAIEGLEAFARSNALRIALGGATYAVPLLILLVTPSLPALVCGIAVVRWIAYALFRRSCVRMLPPLPVGRVSVGLGPLRDAFFEGGWMTLSNVIGPVMVVFDRFALTSLVTLSVLSTYSVPQELALRALLLPVALATTIFPRLAALNASAASTHAIGILVDKSLRIVLALMFPLCMVGLAVAQPALSLWISPEFGAAATPLLEILAIGVIGNTIAQAPFGMLQAVGGARATAIVHLIELPLYVGVVWIAIRFDGVEGAALAWSGRMVIDALAMMLLAQRRQPSILTLRGAYASALSVVMSAVVASLLLSGATLTIGGDLLLAAGSIMLGATFLHRVELHGLLAIAP